MHADFSRLLMFLERPLTLAGFVLVAGFVVTQLACRGRPVANLLCQLASFASFSAMLSVAAVSPFKPTADMGLTFNFVTVSVFKVVWWLAASWLLAGLVRAVLVFKRQPEETRFLQDLCAGLIYVGALLGIVADVFDVPISGLLAASGVIAIVLGLALQNTLGDVFLRRGPKSGQAISARRLGDPGWRPGGACRRNQLARDGAADPLERPRRHPQQHHLEGEAGECERAHGKRTASSSSFRLDPAVPPATGIAALETAMLSCTLILRTPPAGVLIRSLDAVALECEILFFVHGIEAAPRAQNEVFDRVWRHCASAGIRLAPPADSSMVLPPRGAPQDPGDAPRRLLERLPIFLPLSNEERQLLAPKMKRHTYKAGEVLVERGFVTQALYILGSGVLVAFQAHDGSDVEVLRYAPGDCFGQASVLTGAETAFKVKAATRAVVYSIAKDDLAPILIARPAIAADLGQILAIREAAGRDRLSELDALDPHGDHLAIRLGDRVKAFFGLAA